MNAAPLPDRLVNDPAEPGPNADLRALLLDYLDFYRRGISEKLRGIEEDQLRRSILPSGWTPLGLANHLLHMERRWFQWGFLAEQIGEPWGDRGEDGWVEPDDGLDATLTRLTQAGARTREIVEAHELGETARTGGRFAVEHEPHQLHWILLHVLQEYARHAGHLDIVAELDAAGPVAR